MFILTFQINLSELARKYGTSEKTKVGNMVVKEFLIKNDVNLETFKQFRKNDPIPRRRLQKSFGGEITTPVPRTKCSHKGNLKKKNSKWRILLGRDYCSNILPEAGTGFQWYSQERMFHSQWQKDTFGRNKEESFG